MVRMLVQFCISPLKKYWLEFIVSSKSAFMILHLWSYETLGTRQLHV